MSFFRRHNLQYEYAQVRRRAYQTVSEELSSELGVRFQLRGMNRKALLAWRIHWPPHLQEHPEGGWDWEEVAPSFTRLPDGFHLAIWVDDELCALAVGAPSDSHKYLVVHYLEGSPDPRHPLKGKILAVVLAAAQAYAVALGSESVRLKSPAPGLAETFEELGFLAIPPVHGIDYRERRIPL